MGLAKIYPYTKFEVSSFTCSRFTEGGLKFNFWSLDPNHPLFGVFCHAWNGTCQNPQCTEFKVSNFTRSKDTAHVPLNGWVREGVCPNSSVDLRRFFIRFHQIWHQYRRMVSALGLCFRFPIYVFALSNDGANYLWLGMKKGANFGFFGPRSF